MCIVFEKIQAQNTNRFQVSCKVTDAETHKSVAFCHVYNESRRLAFISDSSGMLHKFCRPGDTLAFIAIGYLSQKHIVTSADSLFFTIKLTQQAYEIDAVTIDIPRTYPDLKKAILALNVKKTEIMPELPRYNPYIRPILLDTNVIYKSGFMIMHPVSGLYYRFSKEEQSKRQVQYLKEQELKQPAVDAKYNRRLVSEITGLTDADLTNFIGYCNFNFNYLYNSSSLEIIEMIYKKFDAYKRCCYKPKKVQNTDTIIKK
jgi:hypothetical protein